MGRCPQAGLEAILNQLGCGDQAPPRRLGDRLEGGGRAVLVAPQAVDHLDAALEMEDEPAQDERLHDEEELFHDGAPEGVGR